MKTYKKIIIQAYKLADTMIYHLEDEVFLHSLLPVLLLFHAYIYSAF